MTSNPYGQPGPQPPPWGHPGAPRSGVPAAMPGHPGGSGHPGGYGQPPPPRPPHGPPPGYPPPGPQRPGQRRPGRRKKSAVPWIFASLIALILTAVVLLVGFVMPGLFVRTVFDTGAVQKGVRQVLLNSYKLGAVESVRCPADVPVEPSRTFECRVSLGDQQRNVTVTVKDDRGLYAVGYPR